jgi:hypothetical protein
MIKKMEEILLMPQGEAPQSLRSTPGAGCNFTLRNDTQDYGSFAYLLIWP